MSKPLDFDRYDLDFLVDQYELLKGLYVQEKTLNKVCLLKMQKIFGIYDVDASGDIDEDECRTMLQKCYGAVGYRSVPSNEECSRVFQLMDTDDSKTVTFQEFCVYLVTVMR